MRKLIISIYNSLALSSPYVEVVLRNLYWKNVKKLRRFSPNNHVNIQAKSNEKSNFEEVIEYLKSMGVGEGSLLVVHSSYDGLESTGLEPDEIIDKLLNLIGPTGTLAMPAIRKYKEQKKIENGLLDDFSRCICKYDIKKTPIISGILPFYMTLRKDSVISHHPLNPMVVVGALAQDMIAHNLEGEVPSPHGPNSSWKFCLDNGAIVLWLGVSADHYNTMIHVAEEAFGDWHWSNSEWYNLRRFILIDEKQQREIVVSERKSKWGKLHFAEKRMNKDLEKNQIVKKKIIDGSIVVDMEYSHELVNFLRYMNKKKKGYPYYWL